MKSQCWANEIWAAVSNTSERENSVIGLRRLVDGPKQTGSRDDQLKVLPQTMPPCDPPPTRSALLGLAVAPTYLDRDNPGATDVR